MLDKWQANILPLPFLIIYPSKICVLYIHAILNSSNIRIWSGTADTQLCFLDDLQSELNKHAHSFFNHSHHRNAAIMGLCSLPSISCRGSWKLIDLLSTVL